MCSTCILSWEFCFLRSGGVDPHGTHHSPELVGAADDWSLALLSLGSACESPGSFRNAC